MLGVGLAMLGDDAHFLKLPRAALRFFPAGAFRLEPVIAPNVI